MIREAKIDDWIGRFAFGDAELRAAYLRNRAEIAKETGGMWETIITLVQIDAASFPHNLRRVRPRLAGGRMAT